MKPLRLVAFLEARTVTGPAKNLLQFATLARQQEAIDTTIVVFRRPGDSDVFKQAAENAGVPVEFIEEKGRFDRSVIASITEVIRRMNPDVVQTHAVKGHFLACQAGLPETVRWVAFHHGYTWIDFRMHLYNQLDRWSLRRARHVITVSLPFAAELEKKGVSKERVTVIHNAIDPHWGQRPRAESEGLRERLGITADRKVILIVGRLSREKDHPTLLQAVERLRREGMREAHLLVVGDGPEKHRVEALAAHLGISRCLTLTGELPSAEPYYGLADVAVLSSRTEGSPNALLEAMAARVPVVATSVGGIPEIVSDRESALLVPPGDSQRLAAAIGEVLRNTALAGELVTTAQRLIEQQHSPAVRVRRVAEVYRRL